MLVFSGNYSKRKRDNDAEREKGERDRETEEFILCTRYAAYESTFRQYVRWLIVMAMPSVITKTTATPSTHMIILPLNEMFLNEMK